MPASCFLGRKQGLAKVGLHLMGSIVQGNENEVEKVQGIRMRLSTRYL